LKNSTKEILQCKNLAVLSILSLPLIVQEGGLNLKDTSSAMAVPGPIVILKKGWPWLDTSTELVEVQSSAEMDNTCYLS